MPAPREPFLMEVAVEPTQASDRPALLSALETLAGGGSGIGYDHDPASRQIMIRMTRRGSTRPSPPCVTGTGSACGSARRTSFIARP